MWMLAAMIEMKSRLLVPKADTPAEPLPLEEEPSDLEARLEEKLQEYRAFKEVASALRALEDYQHRIFARPPATIPTRSFSRASRWMICSARSSRSSSGRGKRWARLPPRK